MPREWFSRRALDGYHRTDPPERAAVLRTLLAPSYPPGARWDEPLARAGARFRVEPELNGSEQVICATGFLRGFQHDPLLRALATEHDLETFGDWIVLDPDSTVPALTDERADARTRGRCGAVGVPGGRHARRREVRGARPAREGAMSYTLRGRIESRLAALVLPLAAVLRARRPRFTAGGRSSSAA